MPTPAGAFAEDDGGSFSEPPPPGLVPAAFADDDGLPEATFSEDEEEDAPATTAASGTPFEGPSDGFDFSGSVIADAASETCAFCHKPIEVTWDASRQALVCKGVAMLRHQLFHLECCQRRRGPAE